MRHFKEEEWLDFARKTGSIAGRQRLEQHLADGCASCAPQAHFWRKLREVAGRELYPSPAEGTLGKARAAFSEWRPKCSVKPRRLALIFDSYMQPALAGAGVRGGAPGWRSPRQLLYATKDFQVDLRLEPLEPNGDAQPRLALVGQVQYRANLRSSGPSIPVRVLRGQDVIGEAMSNALGEFQIELKAGIGMRLVIGQTGEFVVPLPD